MTAYQNDAAALVGSQADAAVAAADLLLYGWNHRAAPAVFEYLHWRSVCDFLVAYVS